MKLKHSIEKQARAMGFLPWQVRKLKVWAKGVPQREQQKWFGKSVK